MTDTEPKWSATCCACCHVGTAVVKPPAGWHGPEPCCKQGPYCPRYRPELHPAHAILADANPATFPTDLLVGVESAFAFYGAGFLGRNDVIHLWAAGVRDVAVIDIAEEKLVEMERLYDRPAWTWHATDAEMLARHWADRGERADVVTVDPWTNGARQSINRLPLWLSLARKAVVIGVCADWFAELHLAPSLENFNEWRERSHWNGGPTPPAATRLVWRSNYRQGVFWLTFEVNK